MNTLLSNENQSNPINTKWRQDNEFGDPRWEFVKDMLMENRMWKKRQNVPANKLRVGKVYLMKKRNTSDQCNYENDTKAVRFLGVRNYDTGAFVGVNIPISKLDRSNNDENILYEYVFETFYPNNNGEFGGIHKDAIEVHAYAWNGSLAINSCAINISFFEVNTSGFMSLFLDKEFNGFRGFKNEWSYYSTDNQSKRCNALKKHLKSKIMNI